MKAISRSLHDGWSGAQTNPRVDSTLGLELIGAARIHTPFGEAEESEVYDAGSWRDFYETKQLAKDDKVVKESDIRTDGNKTPKGVLAGELVDGPNYKLLSDWVFH